ncbi:hypothetical protein [Pinirhizobacter sp.]|jgi:hypothetical protein|uniref:hypothetical protein n=1 Tax=Pinirhizobacter sp. TaxID=2950432 RepID=UPI002F4006EB
MDASSDEDLQIFFRSYTELVEQIGRCVGACIAPECDAGMELMLERLEFRDRLGFILDFLSSTMGRRHPLTQEFKQWRRDLTDVNRRWHATVRLERRIGLVRKDTIRLEIYKELAAGWAQQLRSISLRQPSLEMFHRIQEQKRAARVANGTDDQAFPLPDMREDRAPQSADVQAEFEALSALLVRDED